MLGYRLAPLSSVSAHDVVERTARTGEVGERLIVALLMLPLVAWVVMVDARATAALCSAAAAVGCWEYYRLALSGVSLAAQVGIGALFARSQSAETDILTVAGAHGFDEPRLRYLFAFTENRSDAEVRQADVARLRRASGADFDAAFGTAAARALNRQIGAIRKAMAEGVDSEVKGLLDRLPPELEASAQAAERLSSMAME